MTDFDRAAAFRADLGQHPRGVRQDHVTHACPDCPLAHVKPFCPTCLGRGHITTQALAMWQRRNLVETADS